MQLTRRSALTAVLGGIAAVAGVAPSGDAQTLAPLKIATTPTDIGSQVFYAQDQGFFKTAGLDAQVQVISNGGAITAAVSGGAVDVAQSNVVTLAAAYQHGLDIVIVAPAGLYASSAPTSALVVTKNSPIKTGKDLNGKTIAGNGLKNITQVGAFAWMARHGGDPSTAKFVEMPFPEMAAALDAGRIDAALIAEPELSATVGKGERVLGFAYDAIAKQFLIGAWFTTGAWAKAHPDLVKRFQRAMTLSAAWANVHQADSAALLTKYTQILVVPRMNRAVFATHLDPAMMQPLIDASAKYGAIDTTFPAINLIAPDAR